MQKRSVFPGGVLSKEIFVFLNNKISEAPHLPPALVPIE